jgi:hypothetical protein
MYKAYTYIVHMFVNIHKYTWTSPDGKNHNQIGHIYIINIIIIIIIINIKGWAIWPVQSPELQLLSPVFLRSPDCSLSL